MGNILDWFTFKSPEQREREKVQYFRWAFPYGEDQKEKLQIILSELLPDEAPQTALAVYLIGKEGYSGGVGMTPEEREARTEEEKMTAGCRALKKQLPGGHRKKLPYYLALIKADEAVDKTLDYPSVDVLRSQAEALTPGLNAIRK